MHYECEFPRDHCWVARDARGVSGPIARDNRKSMKGHVKSMLGESGKKQAVFDLPDDMATKISIEFHADASDALGKAVLE